VALVNQAPTAVLLNNAINTIADRTSIATRFKLSDIAITDDGLGTNNLTLTGADASSFEIFENALYLKAGTAIDFQTKSSYNVSVNVDDPTVGGNPDAFKPFTLNVNDPNPATNAGGLFITEVAPWSSGNSPVAADWFELTNTSKAAIDITGWKFDDNSNSFAVAATLDGITSIGAGESVVFVDVQTATGAVDAFKSNWFGANVPAGFRIGTYNGVGSGLSTGGDAVNIYNKTGDLQANVVFGGSPIATPFATFDNAALQNNTTISTLSVVGTNGAVSIVSSLRATEIGSPGSIFLNGATSNADTLNGTAGNDTLFGLAGNDTIDGGAGNDTIYGGAGVDLLFGGTGNDVFGFNNANEGIDKINDFVVGEDKIAISRSGFGGDSVFGSGSRVGAALDPSRFTLGSSARLNDDRFIYNANSGALFFDADGAAGNAQVRIAQFVGNPNLTSASFIMV
jgi:Ca2+-binding RTX toxin-like protein